MTRNISSIFKRLGAPLLAAVLVACGGGGAILTSGIGGTGIVFGMITGFGSIYVNGERYRTDDSEFDVDGDPTAGQGDLSVGMVVRLEVRLDENGMFTDRATRVVYDDEVQGPVAEAPTEVDGSGGTQKTFAVFGQTVTIDETTTVFDDVTFDTLAAGDVVEISGFRGAGNAIVASYVKWRERLVPGVSEVELRGTVDGLDSSAREFMLSGILIRYDGSTEIEVAGGLANGKFVEVEGIYNDGPPEFVGAEEIETEDEGFDDVDEISLQGVISDYVDLDDFKVSGVSVDASAAELSPANAADLLGDGVNVEVDGEIVGGVLIADELELRDGEVRLDAEVESIDLPGNRFTVRYGSLPGVITVVVDGQTAFEDGTGAVDNMGIDDLEQGYFVKIEGMENAGEVHADQVKRDDLPVELRLRGPVDNFSLTAPYDFIDVLGIVYEIDGNTEFQDGTMNMTRAAFFGALQIGDEVDIDDEDADGIADEVELEL